jgi:hypothetical protein
VGKNIAGSPYLFLIARGNASNIQVFQKNFTKKEFGLGILSRDFNNTVGLFYWFDLLQKQFKNVESLQFIKQYSIESATNPYDIAYVDSQKAYVSRNDAKELLAIHPLTGSFIKKIALPADNDGYSEMSGLYLNENKLWIQLQMLNRKKLKSAEEVGQIAILDTRLDQLARKPLLMKRKNPTSSFKSFGGNLYVGMTGEWGRFDGGIEAWSLKEEKSLDIIIDERFLGGDLLDFEVMNTNEFITLTMGSQGDTKVQKVTLNPKSIETVDSTKGFEISKILYNPQLKYLYVSVRQRNKYGVRVFDMKLNKEIDFIRTDIPPESMFFIE